MDTYTRFFTGFRTRLLYKGSARILMLYVLLIAMVPGAHAQSLPLPAAPTEADDGALEVGVWYVVDYEDCGGWGLGDLPNTAPDARGLRDRLTATHWFFPFFPYPTPRWQSNFTWGNGMAWEEDWKRAAAGGTEESWVDSVDFAYFAGHGAASGFFFGVGGNSRDDCQTTWQDAQGAWGTRDNDWVGLAACNVLDDPFSNFGFWSLPMNGTRLLMSFQTVMADVPFGDTLGWNLRWGNTFTQAWFRTANQLLPSGQVARILAEDGAYFNDRPANHNSPTVVDNFFSWWTHGVGTPVVSAAATESNLGILQGSMPRFFTPPLDPQAAMSEYEQVANAFGLTTSVPLTSVVAADIFGPQGEPQPEPSPFFISPDGSLLMDANAGVFEYIDQDNLWNVETALAKNAAAANGDAVRAISQDEARQIADAFLENTGLGRFDAQYANTTSDVLSRGAREEGGTAAQVVEEITTNYSVNYERVIQIASGASGAGVPSGFRVVGPGSKMTVLVDATVPSTVTAAGEQQSSVLGGQGGWRDIQFLTAADTNGGSVEILDETTMQILFDELEERVALDYVPAPAIDKTILNMNAAYYEGPMGMQMSELIPVYVLNVEAAQVGGNVLNYEVYVPANAQYMVPYAEILTPDAAVAHTGDTLPLRAADASLTLAELGYDSALTFPLGTGDPNSYTYTWYRNVISDTLDAEGNGLIGTGMTLDYDLAGLNAEPGKPATVKFILVVEDTLKASEPRIAQDEIMLTVNPIYLPHVDGNP